MRRRYLLNSILGVWVIVLSFIGFPSTARRILMIVTGLLIVIISFSKGAEEYIHEPHEEEKQS